MAKLIDITADIKEATRQLTTLQRKQIPFATAYSLTLTAGSARERVKAQMPRVFDRPTKFTMNAFYTRAAKPSRLYSEINLKDGYGTKPHYLEPQIRGGKRIEKPFEWALRARGLLRLGWRAVPGAGATIDAYGNMSRGQIKQVLSYFRAAQMTSGFTANITPEGKARRKRGTKKKRGIEYFVAGPAYQQTMGAERTGHLQPGIYMKTHFGFGAAIKPIIVFVRTARYRPRLPFVKIVNAAVRDEFRPNFDIALRRALATAR